MSWWTHATEAQKLAQIDGGIECGLTANQVAVASGLRAEQRGTVPIYARSHGRSFPTANGSRRHVGAERFRNVGRDRKSYLRGDPIDLWGNTEPQDEFALDEVTP